MAIINLFSKKKSQGEGFIKINKNSLTIYGMNCRDTITVTQKLGNGQIVAVSSNNNICTTSVSGNTITVIPGGTDGTATISIYSAPGTWHGQSNICTCSCTIYNFADATAEPSDIKQGLQLYTRDGLITGTMPVINGGDAGASSSNKVLAAGSYLASDYTIPGIATSFSRTQIKSGAYIQVFDNGGNRIESTGPGTFTNSSTLTGGKSAVTSSQMAKGYTAYIDGSAVSGTLIKDANVILTDNRHTFGMDEGSSTTIAPLAKYSYNCVYDNSTADGSGAYIKGRLQLKDSSGTVVETLYTPDVIFSYDYTDTSVTVYAKLNGSTIASITLS